jgi:hypothetical protein
MSNKNCDHWPIKFLCLIVIGLKNSIQFVFLEKIESLNHRDRSKHRERMLKNLRDKVLACLQLMLNLFRTIFD